MASTLTVQSGVLEGDVIVCGSTTGGLFEVPGDVFESRSSGETEKTGNRGTKAFCAKLAASDGHVRDPITCCWCRFVVAAAPIWFWMLIVLPFLLYVGPVCCCCIIAVAGILVCVIYLGLFLVTSAASLFYRCYSCRLRPLV